MDEFLLKEKIKKLPREQKERTLALVRELETRRRHQTDFISWMEDRLGVKREVIDWLLLAEYQDCHCQRCVDSGNTGSHKWDGTPNPLKAILTHLENKERLIGVESATTVGKTFLAACIVLWFLDVFPNSLVVTTAPKEKQLKLHVWKEIGRLHKKFGKGLLQTLMLRMDPPKEDWIAVGFVAGVKAEETETSASKAQGFHAEHMLIIVEETPGVASAILTAFENTCQAPHNVILALGNPDNQLDTLHKFCTVPGVKHVRISAFDHPNVVLKNPGFIPGAVSEIGLASMLKRYVSADNPMYKSRARGISPSQATNAVIRLEWIKAAQQRSRDKRVGDYIAIGVDVSNSKDGDEAAKAYGLGSELQVVEGFPCPDSNVLGEELTLEMRRRFIQARHVGVDGIGVGAGTINTLRANGLQIINIISSEKPNESLAMIQAEEYLNVRGQMWWSLRLALQDPNSCIIFPDDQEFESTIAELVAVKWEPKNGKILVQSKEDLGFSTNRGDAVVYWNWVRTLHEYGITSLKSQDAQTEESEVEQLSESY